MRRHPIREGVISISVAVGEPASWLGCRQHASPQVLSLSVLMGIGQPRQNCKYSKQSKDGWHCKPSCYSRVLLWKRGAALEQVRDGGMRGAAPKAITVSQTTSESPSQALAQFLPKGQEPPGALSPFGHHWGWGMALPPWH